MDLLKRLEEAKLHGLNKEEYFHLMEMEVKLMEMRKQELQVPGALIGTPGQSENDVQQMLRDLQHQQVRQHEKVCRGIKFILEQLNQLQQEEQDQRHNIGTQISELYRNVDSKLESSVQQMKEELQELRVEMMNKGEGSRSYLRDTITGAKGVKASVFSKIGEVTSSLKGNFHDVRKDIFSRVTGLEGEFLNFESGGEREALPKPKDCLMRVHREQTREKSTSLAQFEQSDEFNEIIQGNENFCNTQNKAPQKLNFDVESKRNVQDVDASLNSENVHFEHSNPNLVSRSLIHSDVSERHIGVSSHQVDTTPWLEDSSAKAQKEITRQINNQPNQTTDSPVQTLVLPTETFEVLHHLNMLPPQLDPSLELILPDNHGAQADQTDDRTSTSQPIQDKSGPHVTSLPLDMPRPQDTSQSLNTPSPGSALPPSDASSPLDRSPTTNTSTQQDAPQFPNAPSPQSTSLKSPKDQDDPTASFVQHLEVLERLFYVVTQQSHQLFLNTVEDKMEQTLNVIAALVTGVKHEISDVSEKEAQLVRDRLSSSTRPRKHYTCDFYVKNFRNMMYSEDSQISLPWHIDQMRSCVKGYVEVTDHGDMYVALMYGRHPSALGLAPRAGTKLKVKATVKDTTGTLPDVVVGEVTWNCNETGVKDNRAWGKKIGVLSCVSLVNQGYGEKEGYAYGSMLIRYEITVIKE